MWAVFYKLSRKALARSSNCKAEMEITEAEGRANRKAQGKTYQELSHISIRTSSYYMVREVSKEWYFEIIIKNLLFV